MKSRYFLLSAVVVAAAFAASVALYQSLPEQMPIHWNIRGDIDNYGAKQWAAFLIPGLMLLWLLVSRVLPWLSPKRFEVDTFRPTYEFIVFLVVAMEAYAHGIVLWAARSPDVRIDRALMAGILLMFALFGNVLGKVRPNFWIGIRTPWTLANEQVWTDTHRLAGRLLCGVGLAGMVAVLAGAPLQWCISAVLAAAIAPALYSLLREKQLASGRSKGTAGPVAITLLALAAVAGGAGWLLSYVAPHEVSPPPALVADARELVANLVADRPQDAAARFDNTMEQALSPAELGDVWAGTTSRHGAYRGERGVRAEALGPHTAIYVTCEFERRDLDVKVVFDRAGRVSGLWFVPPEQR
jgi:uncharacterized membrane protein